MICDCDFVTRYSGSFFGNQQQEYDWAPVASHTSMMRVRCISRKSHVVIGQ
jgi:hypothetical protein